MQSNILKLSFVSFEFNVLKTLHQIGCHHCRGPQPLPADLQKELVEFRGGSVVVLLDKDYDVLIRAVAQKLPNDRQGLAVIWKNKHAKMHNKPSNLFIHKDVDRQDLIGKRNLSKQRPS